MGIFGPSTRDKEALANAIVSADSATVHRMLRDRRLARAELVDGLPALALAAGAGPLDIVETLLGSGASVNQASRDGISPMGAAAAAGRVDTIRFLAEHGASISPPDAVPPLLLAVSSGATHAVRELLARGADPDARSKFRGNTPLFSAPTVEIATLLVDAGATVNARSSEGSYPLHGAALRGDPAMVRFLLDRGADRNQRDAMEWLAADSARAARAKPFETRMAFAAQGMIEVVGDWEAVLRLLEGQSE